MKVFELKRQIEEKKVKLREIKQRAESDTMTESDVADSATLKGEIDALKARIAALESTEEDEVEAEPTRAVPMKIETRNATNNAPAVHSQKHEYSLMRAIRSFINVGRIDGVEAEVSQEIGRVTNRAPRSFFVPHGALNQRALTLTTGAGSIAAIVSDDLIEYFRNKLVVLKLGARVLTGMTGGTFAIPRQSGTASAAWVAEGAAPSGSSPTIDQVVFTPRTIAAYTDVTRKFILDSNVNAEQFVKDDLQQVVTRALDYAALAGSGSSNQPTGLLNNSSVPTVAMGTNGGPGTYAAAIALESTVAAANADLGSLAYVTNPVVRASLKTVPLIGSTFPVFVYAADNTINGYPVEVSNQVPSNLTKGSSSGVCSALIFGNWNDLVVALWSGIDLLVDPYTGSSSGTVRICAFQDADVAPRHPTSFAKTLDITTS